MNRYLICFLGIGLLSNLSASESSQYSKKDMIKHIIEKSSQYNKKKSRTHQPQKSKKRSPKLPPEQKTIQKGSVHLVQATYETTLIERKPVTLERWRLEQELKKKQRETKRSENKEAKRKQENVTPKERGFATLPSLPPSSISYHTSSYSHQSSARKSTTSPKKATPITQYF